MLVPLGGLLLWALISDLRTSTIPNMMFLIGSLYALMATLLGWNPFGLEAMFLGMLIGGLFFAYPLYRSWVGAGDLKLMAMIGLYLGPQMTLMACLYTSIAGGLWIIAYLYGRDHLKRLRDTSLNPKHQEETVPYAMAICVGTLMSLALHS